MTVDYGLGMHLVLRTVFYLIVSRFEIEIVVYYSDPILLNRASMLTFFSHKILP